MDFAAYQVGQQGSVPPSSKLIRVCCKKKIEKGLTIGKTKTFT